MGITYSDLYKGGQTEEVVSVHVHTKNISCEPQGYNTKIDSEGIAGAY